MKKRPRDIKNDFIQRNFKQLDLTWLRSNLDLLSLSNYIIPFLSTLGKISNSRWQGLFPKLCSPEVVIVYLSLFLLQQCGSCRDSSVGRASDWRSEGPWFKSRELVWVLNNPGSRQYFFLDVFRITILKYVNQKYKKKFPKRFKTLKITLKTVSVL